MAKVALTILFAVELELECHRQIAFAIPVFRIPAARTKHDPNRLRSKSLRANQIKLSMNLSTLIHSIGRWSSPSECQIIVVKSSIDGYINGLRMQRVGVSNERFRRHEMTSVTETRRRSCRIVSRLADTKFQLRQLYRH